MKIEKKIVLERIYKKDAIVEYIFSVSDSLRHYFSGQKFLIEYPERIDEIPDAVLAVPFVGNVLPIVWLADAILEVPELDKDFYDSIAKFKKGYIDMYPDASFEGNIKVYQIVNCIRKDSNGAVAFFSGGLDATTTFLRHLHENIELVSIWGADVPYYNEEGWNVVQSGLNNVAKEYNVKQSTIRSTCRLFDNEDALRKAYIGVLHDSWWYAVKHSIGLLCHAAPYVWLHKMNKVYIASSCSLDDVNIPCASHPSIDNNVRFCGASVIYDGFELNRHQKTKYLVQYHAQDNQHKIKLRVCFKSKDGSNCCHCEKCYRTMMSIWIEGSDPQEFGFQYDGDVFQNIRKTMTLEEEYSPATKRLWIQIQEGFAANKEYLKRKQYYREIKWIETFNFLEPEKNWCRKRKKVKSNCLKTIKKIRGWLSQFRAYQVMHKLKRRLMGVNIEDDKK